jgi:hypothetical protein
VDRDPGRDPLISVHYVLGRFAVRTGGKNRVPYAALVQFKLSEDSPASAIKLAGERLRFTARHYPAVSAETRRLGTDIPLRCGDRCLLQAHVDLTECTI